MCAIVRHSHSLGRQCATSLEPTVTGKTISHYRVLEKLGEGGMGVVYEAEDLKLKRRVALKFLSHHATGTDVNRARFVHEAVASAGLDHPSICTVYEIDEADGQVFIAMALIDGECLEDRIAAGPIDIGEAIDIAVCVADGLAAAHEKSVIHRDVKPGNIMTTASGRVKIMDFGLARFSACTTLTSPGATVGTAPYMSPEQATGGDLDGRTDIWSLGTVLYEMLTGQRPFRGDSSPAVVYSIVKEEPEPITGLRTGIPIELERIVFKAMAKDLDERYQSAVDMLVDLRTLRKRLGLGSGTSSALTRQPTPSGQRRAFGRRGALVAVAMAAAAIVVGFAVMKLREAFPKMDPDLVIVVALDNRTGDASLDDLGELAAERFTQGLSQTGSVRVAPASAGLPKRRGGEADAPAVQDMAWLRALAAETGAGTVVAGAYYAEGDDILFRISVTDAARGELVYAFPDIAGPRGAPTEVIEAAAQRVLGLLATDFDPVLDSQPPTYEAYREFMTDMELWGEDCSESAAHFLRVSELDSVYFWPRLMAAHAFALTYEFDRADSIFRSLERERGVLTPFERLNLEWSMAFVRDDFAEGLRRLRQVDGLLEQSKSDKHLHRMSIKRVLGLHALLLNRPSESLGAFDALIGLWEEWEPQEMSAGTMWELLAFKYECMALHMLREHDMELRESRRVMELYPDELEVRLCELRALAALGRTQDVDRAIDECIMIRSESGLLRWLILNTTYALRAHGHMQAAIALAERGIALHESRPAADHRYALAEFLYAAERWDEAGVLFEELAAEHPHDIEYRACLGTLAARRGDRADALAVSAWLERNEHPYFKGESTYRRARIAALLGERERAVELLREALAKGAWLFYDLQAHTDMDLEPLRDYPPFQEFMRPKG